MQRAALQVGGRVLVVSVGSSGAGRLLPLVLLLLLVLLLELTRRRRLLVLLPLLLVLLLLELLVLLLVLGLVLLWRLLLVLLFMLARAPPGDGTGRVLLRVLLVLLVVLRLLLLLLLLLVLVLLLLLVLVLLLLLRLLLGRATARLEVGQERADSLAALGRAEVADCDAQATGRSDDRLRLEQPGHLLLVGHAGSEARQVGGADEVAQVHRALLERRLAYAVDLREVVDDHVRAVEADRPWQVLARLLWKGVPIDPSQRVRAHRARRQRVKGCPPEKFET